MAVPRTTRLNALLQRELGTLLETHFLTGRNVLVTVTGVRISQDLRDATVYVSIYGSETEQHRLLEDLEKKRSLLQSALASRVIMKYTPILHFKKDDTAAQADRVMHILHDLKLDDEGSVKDDKQP